MSTSLCLNLAGPWIVVGQITVAVVVVLGQMDIGHWTFQFLLLHAPWCNLFIEWTLDIGHCAFHFSTSLDTIYLYNGHWTLDIPVFTSPHSLMQSVFINLLLLICVYSQGWRWIPTNVKSKCPMSKCPRMYLYMCL